MPDKKNTWEIFWYAFITSLFLNYWASCLLELFCFFSNKFQFIQWVILLKGRLVCWHTRIPTSLPTTRDIRPQWPVAKDLFWIMADQMPLGAAILFKSVEEDDSTTSTKLCLRPSRRYRCGFSINSKDENRKVSSAKFRSSFWNLMLRVINYMMPGWEKF